jgi:DNA-binding transcriptional LysR family regulator
MSAPVRTPDLSELRGLVAAADLGSVGRAALRLRISQPALSKRLQNLEQLVGVQLFVRSPRGVELTPAGRRLYEEAQRVLAHAAALDQVVSGLRHASAPVRLAASHSASEAFAADALGAGGEAGHAPVELVIANSVVVRAFVADGRADLGVAASRPEGTPNPGVREERLVADEVVCAVPGGHLWANRRRITQAEFLRTPMVVRDPQSNARWTVDAELRRRGVQAAPPLVQASTPLAARREALTRNAPLLLSRNVIRDHHFVEVAVDGLTFRRSFVLVLPPAGEPHADARVVADRLRAAASKLA